MRSLNFFFIFLICLALVLFSIENTQPVAIQVIKGVEVKGPLCLELIMAAGLGAILAWLFSLWSRMQRTLASRQQLRQVREKEQRIQELEENLERYKAEVEGKQPLLESAEPISLEIAAIEGTTAEITAN
ncbi:LapA family protein [Microcoleus asticus]|uniref:Lipopolysaccharide assembly protein A n=1 Tax=Microcoleus asticus IPMA8 TaxID=2563858 RepID=A0ABX2CUW1_9CYAN|nr:LapA family protein [Microcoleus asticus]NQE33708.1 Lipopolysaccharide assembly protein A [Microcoleus asticus IPMA8]